MTKNTTFPELGDNFSFPELELLVLKYWQEDQTFAKSLAQRAEAKPYVFYDGPPFATGLPHHGHLLASSLKDIIPSYFTMQGYFVERRFGWDCHGLPVEYEIDKQEGKTSREIVAEKGVAGYNDLCRGIVQKYTSQWEETITRMGRWVDFENDYKTMDPEFMESVWWVFKQLWEQGLIYQGSKVVAYSTALGTVLSNFEAGSNYQDVQDPSITVLLSLCDKKDQKLAIWTTTPWTLPSNLGVCVGADIEYVLIKAKDRDDLLWLAKARVNALFSSEDCQVVDSCFGRDLVGLSYEPLFDYFLSEKARGAFKIHADDFVSIENGTGLVHMAPAFGEDDHRVMSKTKVNKVCPIDDEGCFTLAVKSFAKVPVKQADKLIIKHLKNQAVVLKHETIVHSYPHCPRSDTPLIYRTIPSWYIEVTALKKQLLKANEQINWVPNHIKQGRFGKWLDGAKDWAVSRNRVWGSPLPLWLNDANKKVKCIGSIDELEELTGVRVTDLHREHVDSLTFTIKGELGVYRRVPEVLDCWFESGAMPYAQKHYPFANKKSFDDGFPAAFIAEGLDQTRGWFYTLTVLAVALFDKPAFKNVIVSGIVMAEDGKKMSKRLKNYTAPDKLIAQYGADALRLYLINSSLVKGQEQRFKDEGVKEMVRQTLLPWYNAAKFLITYAKVDGWHYDMERTELSLLDQWLLSRLQSLKSSIANAMLEYKLYLVIPELLRFLDELTNIYIRLNRSRFWEEGCDGDKCVAYFVLYQALFEFSCCMAPFAPFCAEIIHQSLLPLKKGTKKQSVHCLDYPKADKTKIKPQLEEAVLRMHQVIVLGRQCRNEAKIKTKIPLKSLKIIHKDPLILKELSNLEAIIKQELNVLEIVYEANESDYIELSAKPCSPILGKRFGAQFKQVRQIIESMSKEQILTYETDKKIILSEFEFLAGDILVFRQAATGLVNIVSNRWVTIQLDCDLDDDLLAQGLAREVINRVQKTRKTMDLHVSDRIKLTLYSNGSLHDVLKQHQDIIMKETLSLSCVFFDKLPSLADYQYHIDEDELGLSIEVVG